MKRFLWRVRVSYWFIRLSGMPVSQAWSYSDDMREFFDDEFGPCDPRDAVEIEMSYWEN